MFAKTLANPVKIKGIGIHTGEQAQVIIGPGSLDQGVIIQASGGQARAVVQNAPEADRRTDIAGPGLRVMTVEHVLAALAGMEVSHALIQVQGPEMPFGDGSCADIARELKAGGLVSLEEPAPVARLTRAVEFAYGNSRYRFIPSQHLEISCEIRYQHPFLREQRIELAVDPQSFLQELAPARTYAFFEEIQGILAKGLGKGGDLDNVLVITRDGYMNQARFPDEPVRHKALDLLGDMFLLGALPRFRIEAVMPGHRANRAAVRFLLKQKELLI